MNRTRLILAVLTTVLIAAGCGAGSKNNDDASAESTAAPTASSSTAPETSTTTSPETTDAPATDATTEATEATAAPATDATTETIAAPATAVPAGDVDCLDGEWAIGEITASDATFTVSGAVEGMTMTFAPGTWTLRATDASVPAEVDGTPATLSLDGDAAGQMATLGDRLQFSLDDADGTATGSAGGMEQELSFEDVIVALGPSGEATSTCSATAATLTTATTTIDLAR